MHDLDRNLMESEFETEYEFNEMEYEADEFFEYENEYEYEDEFSEMGSSPFSEEEEFELAAELLAVGSDEELDEFLGKLIRKAARGVKRFARSKVGRAIGRGLKSVAKKALPIAGKAVGGFFGGPVGASIGGKLGGFASRLFEMELEGMSPEDQETAIRVNILLLRASGAIHDFSRSIPATFGVNHPIHSGDVRRVPHVVPLLWVDPAGRLGRRRTSSAMRQVSNARSTRSRPQNSCSNSRVRHQRARLVPGRHVLAGP